MCGTYSAGFPHSLGHAGDGHDSLVVITFPVGGSLDDSLAANLSCLEGFFL